MELRDYLHLIARYWLAILLFVLLSLAGAFGWVMLQPKVYSATASGYVSSTQQSGDAGADGVTNGDNQSAGSTLLKDELARAKIKSYTDIGSWRAVAETVIDDWAST